MAARHRSLLTSKHVTRHEAGIAFEEHDLMQSLGETYAAYRARVPALIPRPSYRQPTTTPTRRR